jgi:hypothetical protein
MCYTMTMVTTREITAIHESAHAVIALAIGMRVSSITMHAAKTLHPRSRSGRQKNAIAAFAGPLAEARYCNLSADEKARLWREDWAGDLRNIFKHDDIGPIEPLRELAEELVGKHWAAIMRVARALHTRGTLSGDQVEAFAARRRAA